MLTAASVRGCRIFTLLKKCERCLPLSSYRPSKALNSYGDCTLHWSCLAQAKLCLGFLFVSSQKGGKLRQPHCCDHRASPRLVRSVGGHRKPFLLHQLLSLSFSSKHPRGLRSGPKHSPHLCKPQAKTAGCRALKLQGEGRWRARRQAAAC